MKRNSLLIVALGVLFLSFIQLAGTLVESIYLLDLLHSTLDAKVVAVLFFFTPLLLLPFYKKWPRGLLWGTFALLALTRSALPYLKVFPRLLVSGLGVLAVVSLFFLLLRNLQTDETRKKLGVWAGAGFGLAIALSTLLRTVYHGVEYSLAPTGGWTGIVLMIVLGYTLWQLSPKSEIKAAELPAKQVTGPVVGLFLVLGLAWFAFSAPAVMARWTQGDYTLIVAAVSLLSTGWVLLSLLKPGWTSKISRGALLVWNGLFTLSLTATIALQQAALPTLVDETFTVAGPTLAQLLALGVTLLLFPVIFLDMQVLLAPFAESTPAPQALVPGILLGSFLLILMVFANIFTNVWGYVPLGDFFRGKYWLTYLLMAGLVSVLVWGAGKVSAAAKDESASFHWGWGGALAAILIATVIFALPVAKVTAPADGRSSIKVMTYNIQQANDRDGEKSFERQLALIREVAPDVLSMQETDSARISLNNNDYVRFYADSLGYYSYFGPTPVNGTYGTSLISKYPLQNPRTVYIYSDKDENAIAVAEVTVSGQTFTFYDVHPDGSPTVDMSFARTLIAISKDVPNVIALGDYNLRDYEDAYKLIDSVYTNVWTSVFPNKIGADGVDMSGENRIDHIFISHNLRAENPVFITTDKSETDHAVHWSDIAW
ncbi:MAG: endonuclease/exonuclease/phosphatase family protein [Anaerolineaceae bacterium]|nr:endonuclease/exonuclease/phosphatase family protein [Anaerolineaceae bacterium]